MRYSTDSVAVLLKQGQIITRQEALDSLSKRHDSNEVVVVKTNQIHSDEAIGVRELDSRDVKSNPVDIYRDEKETFFRIDKTLIAKFLLQSP